MSARKRRRLGLAPAALACLLVPGFSRAERPRPERPPVTEPQPVTSEPEPILDFAVSRDGRRVVVSESRDGFADLWLRSGDPSRPEVPRRLTFDPADETSPALSADGRRVAYVGHGDDVKGDLYVLDLEAPDAGPRRLTGREGEEGGPAFSPDGKALYFHRVEAGRTRLFRLRPADESPRPEPLESAGEGAFPSVSPDGRRLAFVSTRDDPAGDVFVFDLTTGTVGRLTEGPAVDSYPTWSSDGSAVYFTRFALDTDGDGFLTPRDNGVVFRIASDGRSPAFPVTSAGRSSLRAQVGGARLCFLSPLGGVQNVASLPLEGEIPALDSAERQLALARSLASRFPPARPLAVLAFLRVLERFPSAQKPCAQAAYEAGGQYLAQGFPDAAEAALVLAVERYGDVVPEAPFSAIRLAVLRAHRAASATSDPAARRTIREAAAVELRRIAADRGAPAVRARAGIEEARLLLEFEAGAAPLSEALALLDAVVRDFASERPEAAEALVIRVGAYGRVAPPADLRLAYLAALDAYPDVEEWADRAAEAVLDLAVADLGSLEERLRALRDLAAENKTLRPRLAMAALNRAGDLSFAADEWAQAKTAYREVLETFPVIETRTAAARLALAEILYREERYREALDLYEAELRQRPAEDPIYRLSRAGYLRKSAEAGEFLFRTGELSAARKVFKELIDYDDGAVEGHRGYIKCAAAQKGLEPVLAAYRARLDANPEDPVALYAAGLALTYRENGKDTREALRLLEKASALNGQVEYFHQTLGYVQEVLETAYGDKGRLEAAAQSYQVAYLLNDHRANPENAANLLLNLGNAYHLLGQHRKAFAYYRLRLGSAVPFEGDETEILFFRRLGVSAFQAGEPAATVEAFTKALSLVEARRDSRRASEAFDAVSRYVLEKVVAPSRKAAPAEAEALARAQSDVNGRLAGLSRADVPSPPDPRWKSYRSGVEALLTEQERVSKSASALLRSIRTGRSGPSAEEAEQSLDYLAGKVRAALAYPERLARLEAELLDRLGLARQEAGDWRGARESFERALDLNERLGLVANLARNQRSAAYAAYQEAGALAEEPRRALLEVSAKGFRRAIELVGRHGVPDAKDSAKEAGKDGGLLEFRLAVTLDKGGSTQAAQGFTAEQEVRLCEAFLARIGVELGDLDGAGAALDAQLARYPAGKAVAEEDVYGVSLLFHRAGQLAAARGEFEEAFARFQRSLELSLRLGGTAATCLNAADMGHAAARASAGGAGPSRLVPELTAADRRASALLKSDAAASAGAFGPWYHNAMGFHWAELAATAGRPVSPEAEAFRAWALARAAGHFAQGLGSLGKPEDPGNAGRGRLALVAALSLNLAEVASDLGEGAADELGRALQASRLGLLPELEWRALARLGRREEALAALESVPVSRAGCGPQEIQAALGESVRELAEAGKAEEAFDLAERLSELERVNRLAPLTLGHLSAEEKRLARDAYPRLLRMRELRRRAGAAAGEEAAYLQASLERETSLLKASLGEGLPTLGRLARDRGEQDAATALLGLSVAAEELADAAAAAGPGEEGSSLRRERDALLGQARQVLGEAVAQRPEGEPAGLLALFGPEPAQAVDAMAALPEGGALVRLARAGGAFVAFTLTPERIDAKVLGSASELVLPAASPLTVAFEDPSALSSASAGPAAARALSATHFVRSTGGRKAFKRSFLSLPPGFAVPEGYEGAPLAAAAGDREIREALAGIHTLLLAGPVRLVTTVPTRAGERPRARPAAMLGEGRSLPVAEVARRGENLSLALVPRTAPDAWYPTAHLFSLFGCPTAILGGDSAQGSGTADPAVSRFLAAYAGVSAQEALGSASADGLVLLGYRGMDRAEGAAFARARFEQDVKKAQGALAAGDPVGALPLIEAAILTARGADELRPYLPDLYRFGRESAYRAGRFERAREHAGALVDLLAASAPDTQAHAEALLALGLLEARLEQYPASVSRLEEAREMFAALELQPEEAAAVGNLGTVLENMTEYDRALREFEAAAGLGQGLGQKEFLARQHTSIGRLYDLRLSEYARAAQSYGAALALYRELGDRGGEAQALLDVGRCDRLLGNFSEAAERYGEALALVGVGSSEAALRLKARIWIEQANSAWYQARYQEAFELGRASLSLAREKGWGPEQVMACNTSGLLWWSLGEPDKALRELDEALSLARTLSVREDEVATTLNNIGLVHRESGNYPKALEALDSALAIDRRLKSRWAIAYDLRNKGLTLLRMGRAEEGFPLLEEAHREASAIGDRVNQAKALLALGEARLALGKTGEAAAAFEEALGLSRPLNARETQWRALYGLAQVHLKAGESGQAREALAEAVGVIEQTRASLKIEQLRDGFLNDKLSVYEALVRVLADGGDPLAAFETAERSRARGFIDLLGNQRLTLAGAVEQGLYERQQTLAARVEEAEGLLAGARSDAERSTYAAALSRLRDDRRDLLLEIQAKDPQLASLVSVQPLGAAEVQGLLEEGVALLSYYVVEDQVFSWLLTRDRVELFRTPVGRDTLGRAILEFRRIVQNLEPVEARSKALFDLLVAPVLPRLQGVKTLGIIPHGSLHYLSFGTLFDGAGYLVERVPLFYLPSASVLRYTLERRKAEKSLRVLAIGNPDLGDPFLDLPFAEQEVDSIRWDFPSVTVLTREKATETWVTRHIAEFGIIHLASHGEFDPINPLFSAVKLAKDKESDGSLDAAEVFGLRLTADLVVLSACQTGLGKVTQGDDVVGLNRAFVYAGTHTLISSLWRVSDVSTAVLAKQFYREYAVRDKAEALRRATLHVKNRYPHPGYWGAFLLTGDYR